MNMTILHEILFDKDDLLYTTTRDFDHSFFAEAVSDDDLRLFTKEDARELIELLKEKFFSEPTHIKVYFDYRDGMHEYQETSQYPLMGKWDVDYDNLGEHGLYALFVLGEISEENIEKAEENYSDADDMYWDGSRLMRIWIEMITKDY